MVEIKRISAMPYQDNEKYSVEYSDVCPADTRHLMWDASSPGDRLCVQMGNRPMDCYGEDNEFEGIIAFAKVHKGKIYLQANEYECMGINSPSKLSSGDNWDIVDPISVKEAKRIVKGLIAGIDIRAGDFTRNHHCVHLCRYPYNYTTVDRDGFDEDTPVYVVCDKDGEPTEVYANKDYMTPGTSSTIMDAIGVSPMLRTTSTITKTISIDGKPVTISSNIGMAKDTISISFADEDSYYMDINEAKVYLEILTLAISRITHPEVKTPSYVSHIAREMLYIEYDETGVTAVYNSKTDVVKNGKKIKELRLESYKGKATVYDW
jgi:hypothetical protein